MLILVFTLLVLLWFVYSGLLLYFYRSWQRAVSAENFTAQQEVSEDLRISVVVALRNESGNIPSLLRSFHEQLLDKSLFEILLVDDFSTDHTGEEVQRLLYQYPGLDVRLLYLSDSPNVGEGGKKAAVSWGVSQAKYPVISITDADCRPPAQWLAKVRHKMSSGQMKVLCGPVLISDSRSGVEDLQQFDFAVTQLINSGASFRHFFHLGNAANFTFLKSFFEEIGGYSRDQYASGDDVLLLQKISEKDRNTIYFSPERGFAVYTVAEKTGAAFYMQRLRWASKNKSYRNPYLQLTQITVFLVNFFTLLLLISLPLMLFGKITVLVPTLLIVKFSLDYYIANQAFNFYHKQSIPIGKFIVNWFNHGIYISYIGAKSLLIRNYEWKGRVLR